MKTRSYFLMNVATADGGDGGGGGGAIDINVTDGNQGTYTSSVPVTGGAGAADQIDNAGFLDSINLEHRDSLKNVKDINDLASQYINSQKLIGKKTIGVLAEDASDEQWSEHYSKIRPESADKYEFSNEGLGEDFKRDEGEATAVKTLMHEAGLSQKQAAILQSGYDKMVQENNQPRSQEVQEASFLDLGTETFGKDYDSVISGAEKISAEMIPDSIKNLVHSSDDETMMFLAGLLNSVQTKYGNEDTVAGDTSGANFSNPADRRVEAGRIMSTDAYKNNMHPRHEDAKKELSALYPKG